MTGTSPSPGAALDAVDAALAAIPPEADYTDTFFEVQALARALVDLGRFASLHPQSLQNAETRQRLAQQARQLLAIHGHLYLFQTRWEGHLWSGFEQDWDSLCIARSSFEFLIALYRPVLDPQTDLVIEPEDLSEWDEYIADQFVHFGGVAEADIPAGIPESHWWWRDVPD